MNAIFFLALSSLLTGSASAATPVARISSFSPEGEAKEVRQVRASFSEAMVPFGDPRASLQPFDIQCPETGSARWADQKNWVFDFDRDLPAGIRCEFKLKPGLRSFAGREITGKGAYQFSTGGPAIKLTRPWEGSRIQEDQAFVLQLDAEAAPASIERGAYFQVEGIQEPIGVKILGGAARDEILKAAFRYESEENPQEKSEKKKPHRIVIQGVRPFPPGQKVTLIWGKSVATPSGAASPQDQLMAFEVRDAFTATLSCDRENAESPCIPFSSIRLQFSAPVATATALKARLRSEKTSSREWKPVKVEGEETSEVVFEGPFPESTAMVLSIPPGLRDESERKLVNEDRFPVKTGTGAYPPLAKFAGTFGILESKPEPVLPVTLRNLDARVRSRMIRIKSPSVGDFASWSREISRQGYGPARGVSILGTKASAGEEEIPLNLPRPGGQKAFEVVGIPLPKPGFYVVEIESTALGASLLKAEDVPAPGPMYVSAAVLVTDLSVHFKKGRESSLVWVTTLSGGKPVAGAKIEIRDCHGTVHGTATTDSKGIADLPGVPESVSYCQNFGEFGSGYFATASLGADFSFAHTNWSEGIESWRFGLPGRSAPRPVIAQTVFDRTLFRAGETVHMKHIIRRHSMKGFNAVPGADLPKSVRIRHQGSNQRFDLPLSWDGDSAGLTTWTIPKEVKLGHYQVSLRKEPAKLKGSGADMKDSDAESGEGDGEESYGEWDSDTVWRSGEFRVEEYRVPLMKASIQGPSQKQIATPAIDLDLSVEYLSGGGAARLPVIVRHRTQPAGGQSFDAFDDFTFSNGPFRPSSEAPANAEPQIRKLDLDSNGTARARIEGIPASQTGSQVQVELEYRDPNGAVQTTSQSITIHPASRLVAVKPDSWLATVKSLKFKVAVVDLQGKPVADAPVEVKWIENRSNSHRKKLVGGFYAYENSEVQVDLGQACSGKTDAKGLVYCDKPAPKAGNLILIAQTKDEAGRASIAHSSAWVHEGEDSWFAQGESDRIDVLPELKRYEPGTTARLQVRMPFREAQALVTVEREGVLDRFVVPLTAAKPWIDVPMKANYAPNVFVSAFLVRGRAGEVQPTALVDLGKPAYRLGIAEVRVGWKAHELAVKVTPAEPTYKVRGRAKARIQVVSADGSKLESGAEAAVAVVDEGLLLLKPNDSWKLLEAMMDRRGHEVGTSTAQSQVIGKRHYGLKAVPAGGDGGKSPTRELFDTLLLWKGRVKLDANGEASVDIPLNDSITSYRIVAVATSGNGRFGTGQSRIQTTQDLMILPGVSPLAREGDQMPAEITLRNTTKTAMDVTLSGRASPGDAKWAAQTVRLEPASSKRIVFPFRVPVGVEQVVYEWEAKSGDSSDRVVAKQRVVPVVAVQVYQATIAQVEKGAWSLPIEKPADALPDRGSVRVSIDRSIGSSLTGVKDYMSRYPYTCLEQKTSRSIALRDAALFRNTMGELPAYLDGDGLAKYFPGAWNEGSDSLTAYLVSIAHESAWEIPADPLARMLGGLTRFVEGKIQRLGALKTSDLTVRKIAALEALSRHGKSPWSLVSSIDANPRLLPTSAVIDWWAVLKRTKDVPGGAARILEAEQILRSRLNFQGTTMGFSTEKDDWMSWLMVSVDRNANRMLLSILEEPTWKEDVPRVVRGALSRQRHGHWDTTPANAWGVLAIEKFMKRFEAVPVAGSTSVQMGAQKQNFAWTPAATTKQYDLAWAPAKAELEIKHPGAGKPWVMVQSRAAIPLKKPLSTGYRIKKSVEAVERKKPGQWSESDIVRVKLELEAQSDMTWVVLNDPIPAGSQLLGSGLGGESAMASRKESGSTSAWGSVWLAFEERSFEAFRAYYQYVPKGTWTVEYTLRLNQSGSLALPTTRVEAMYAPEMFGENPNESYTVVE